MEIKVNGASIDLEEVKKALALQGLHISEQKLMFPKKGVMYTIYNDLSGIGGPSAYNTDISHNLDALLAGSSFPNKEEAEIELEKRRALVRIRRYMCNSNITLIDPINTPTTGSMYSYIVYDTHAFAFAISSFAYSCFVGQYFVFKDSADASKVINQCGADLKIYFGVK